MLFKESRNNSLLIARRGYRITQNHAAPKVHGICDIADSRHIEVLHVGLKRRKVLRMLAELFEITNSLLPGGEIVAAVQL